MGRMDNQRHDLLTVVVACFNEADSLPLLHPRIRRALDGLEGVASRILYVDDGSRDATWQRLQEIAAADPEVALLRLSGQGKGQQRRTAQGHGFLSDQRTAREFPCGQSLHRMGFTND